MPVFRLTDQIRFPPPHLAEAGGLLAVGGDLSPERLLAAYRSGIFPWYMVEEPILWWSPDPRLVLIPDDLRISKSLRKIIRQNRFHITCDMDFEGVIRACSVDRVNSGEQTWITADMQTAYIDLFRAGYAHSVEAWRDGRLAGGLYGVSLGGSFFGESMFTRVSNASKAALCFLAGCLHRLNFDMIDCQVSTDHLKRFGAREISRRHFLTLLEQSLRKPTLKGRWTF